MLTINSHGSQVLDKKIILCCWVYFHQICLVKAAKILCLESFQDFDGRATVTLIFACDVSLRRLWRHNKTIKFSYEISHANIRDEYTECNYKYIYINFFWLFVCIRIIKLLKYTILNTAIFQFPVRMASPRKIYFFRGSWLLLTPSVV